MWIIDTLKKLLHRKTQRPPNPEPVLFAPGQQGRDGGGSGGSATVRGRGIAIGGRAGAPPTGTWATYDAHGLPVEKGRSR